jgi:hypothetical protein
MVIDARRRRNTVSKFELDNTVIQHGFELRGRALQLRIIWAILWNFKSLSPHLSKGDYADQWATFVLHRLTETKDRCIELLIDAEKANMVKQQIEAMIYHAQFVALELNHSPAKSNISMEQEAEIRAVERNNLARCDALIAQHKSAEYLEDDVAKARSLIGGGTFYSFVSSEEKKEIYAAMAGEFRGTGHWYYCEQGHPVCFSDTIPVS